MVEEALTHQSCRYLPAQASIAQPVPRNTECGRGFALGERDAVGREFGGRASIRATVALATSSSSGFKAAICRPQSSCWRLRKIARMGVAPGLARDENRRLRLQASIVDEAGEVLRSRSPIWARTCSIWYALN